MSLWRFAIKESEPAEQDAMNDGEGKVEVEVAGGKSQSIAEAERLLREFRDAVDALKTPPQLNIQADKFVLVDAQGRRRAELTMAADGTPGLFLYDDNGVRRGSFNLSAAGAPALVLHDKVGKARAEVALRTDGVVGLGFYDDKGEGRAELFVASDGAAALYLLGSHGERIAELPAAKNGADK
jgi:hypothetical protein